MKVKLLVDYGGFEVGEVIWWPDAKEAKKLAKAGIVEIVAIQEVELVNAPDFQG